MKAVENRGRWAWGVVSGALLAGLVGVAARPGSGAPAAARKLELPSPPLRYAEVRFPAHFEERLVRTFDNTPADNPTTDAGAALGRALFYDVRLSANGTMSCGSCHRQDHAFASPERVDTGYQGRRGDRNTMSLVNLRFTRARFFWDERSRTLEEAVLMPVHSRLELGHTPETLVRAVSGDERYAPLFRAAFGSVKVTEERVARALAQFVRSLVSCDSRYDRAVVKVKTTAEDFPDFTPQENLGKRLFLQRCGLCHHIGEGEQTALFGTFRSLHNGLDPDRSGRDGGLGDITFNPGAVGAFKSPDLRNVAVTAPYMHSGRFDTLEEVVQHYSEVSGVQPASRFLYTGADKAALVAFLKTLTDERFLRDPRFSDPWNGAALARIAGPPDRITWAQRPPDHSPAHRLSQGLALRSGEALPWLQSLDSNGDRALDAAEYAPVIEILARDGVERLGEERGRVALEGPQARNSAEAAVPDDTGVLLGDFNADGKVDEAEAVQFTAVKRQVELGDGGRLETILDRMLTRFPSDVDHEVALRAAFRTGKHRLNAKSRAAAEELEPKLRGLLGPQPFTRYQELVIQRALQRAVPPPPATLLPGLREQIMALDVNATGRLDPEEIAALAKLLDDLPRGLGAGTDQPLSTDQFRQRLQTSYAAAGRQEVDCSRLPQRMQRLAEDGDCDGNGFLSSEEISAYLRAAGFRQVVAEGVYVNGGFGDAYVESASALEKLELDPRTLASAQRLVRAHASRLENAASTALREIFLGFQAILKDRLRR